MLCQRQAYGWFHRRVNLPSDCQWECVEGGGAGATLGAEWLTHWSLEGCTGKQAAAGGGGHLADGREHHVGRLDILDHSS